MLTIVTGLPGHGKTVNTLQEVHASHGGKRTIYYSGIPDLTLPGWQEFVQPEQWHMLPEGSCIVIDEAQRAFPQRQPGPAAPHVAPFETHRHRGLDIWLITQDAKLLDHSVRRLAGAHVHFWRPFGASRVTRWEWQRVVDPNDYHQKKEAISKRVQKLPASMFACYTSATMHTVQAKFPMKLYALPALAVVIVLLAFWAVRAVTAGETRVEDEKARKGAAPGIEAPRVPSVDPPARTEERPVPKPIEYVGRVAGIVQAPGLSYAVLESWEGSRQRVALTVCLDAFSGWVCELEGGTYEQGAKPPKPKAGGGAPAITSWSHVASQHNPSSGGAKTP